MSRPLLDEIKSDVDLLVRFPEPKLPVDVIQVKYIDFDITLIQDLKNVHAKTTTFRVN